MTRDNFLDIMGDIDRELIDDALNIQRAERVELRYERRTVPRFITGIAACAAVFAMIIFVRFFAGIDTDPNDSSVSLGNSYSALEFKRGWDPKDLIYKKPNDFWVIGENVRVSAAEFDGITAELILKNIKKEAGTRLVNELTDFDYTGYVGAEEIALYIHDKDGGRFITNNVTPHSYNDMKLINAACLFDGSTRIYKTDSEYVIMQYADYYSEQDMFIAGFYGMDTNRLLFCDENGIFDCSAWRVSISGEGRMGGWKYGYQASKSFEYTGGNKFSDPGYGYEMLWDKYGKVIYPDKMPEGYKSVEFENITGWDPEKLPIGTVMSLGESVIIDSHSADGITASLILHNVIKRPGDRHYIYTDDKYLDMWAADEIYLYITDTKGHRVLSRISAPLSLGTANFIPNSCLLEGAVRVAKTEDENVHYIMMYLIEKNGMPYGIFFNCDLDQMTANSPKDENGISLYDGLGDLLYANDNLYPFYEEMSILDDIRFIDKAESYDDIAWNYYTKEYERFIAE